MSSQAATATPATNDSNAHDDAPLQYVLIAVALVVITALEVALFYIEKNNPALSKAAIVIPLLVLAGLKFVIVVQHYMHLKHDHPIFKRYFVLGLSGAFVLYLIVLSSLRIFG